MWSLDGEGWCLSFQGPAGLKGGEGLPGVAGAIVSLILLKCLPSYPLVSIQLLCNIRC